MKVITIPGIPVGQGRPRFTRTGHAYDPARSRLYKQSAAIYARQQWPGEALDYPLSVKVRVYRPIQQSATKAQRKARLEGRERPTVKPDADNYYKAVTDALTGIVWVDDNLIVHAETDKFYDDGNGPRVEVEVEAI